MRLAGQPSSGSFAADLGETVEDTRERLARGWPMQSLVRHWHRIFGYFVSEVPTVPDRHTREIRYGLIAEEFQELRDELLATYPDIKALTHEAGDLLFVTLGLFVEIGVSADDVLRALYRANMTKTANPGGKALKGEDFVPADIEGAIRG